MRVLTAAENRMLTHGGSATRSVQLGEKMGTKYPKVD
jgi:hypothetical protein